MRSFLAELTARSSQRIFTLGDGRWLPKEKLRFSLLCSSVLFGGVAKKLQQNLQFAPCDVSGWHVCRTNYSKTKRRTNKLAKRHEMSPKKSKPCSVVSEVALGFSQCFNHDFKHGPQTLFPNKKSAGELLAKRAKQAKNAANFGVKFFRRFSSFNLNCRELAARNFTKNPRHLPP